ncbi:MAG TPA: prepilin-type N-terminal cleavage/methylation domain-containing protein [Gemmatimonadales bacterium]
MRVRADERGFTIPEMLIATVLVASAAGLIATAIYEVFVVARSGNARLAALSDLETASLWIGRDASEAQSFAAGSGTVYGTLTTSTATIQYQYSYDSANTALVREVLVSGSPTSTLQIARRIAAQGNVAFSLSGSLLTVSITSTVGPTSETTTLKLGMRVK